MRYLKLLAVGMLFAGLSSANAQYGDTDYEYTEDRKTEWKLGVGAQTSAANLDAYHMGVGGTAVLAVENQMGRGDTRLGVRGNYLNFEPQEDAIGGSFQEYGAALEALVGPSGMFFEPKVGGHVGYVRMDGSGFDERNLLDVGADVMANFDITPNLGLQALVTPLWLIEEDDTDYQTRGSVSLLYTIPGA